MKVGRFMGYLSITWIYLKESIYQIILDNKLSSIKPIISPVMKWPQVFAKITPNLGDCVFVKIEINLESTIRFLLSIVTPTIGSEHHRRSFLLFEEFSLLAPSKGLY